MISVSKKGDYGYSFCVHDSLEDLFYFVLHHAEKTLMVDSRCTFRVCYLRMQMQTLCRAIEILITTSCSTSVKFFYRGLTEIFIASPFCDQGHEGQVKRSHLSWICREPR